MSFFEIFILSFVEGLTEFLPISSTGHLIIASKLLQISPSEFSTAFDIIIQFGAIAAVCVIYFDRFKLGLAFYKKLLIGFLPAAAIGFLFKDMIRVFLESTTIVAWSLILGGVIMIITDRLIKVSDKTQVSDWDSLKIGLFQCFAFIPGVSRSASTIIGAQLLGIDRKTAAEFSFFLAVPTLTAAALYKTYKIRHIIQQEHLTSLILGIILSFIFAMIAIKFFIKIVQKYGFKWFGIYRILIGLIVLFYIN